MIAGKLAQDVALDAVVDGDDMEFRLAQFAIAFAPRPRRFLPGEALAGRDHRHEVHADQPRPGLGLAFERVEIEAAGRLMRDHCIRHAVAADESGKRARIDAGKPDDAAALEPGIEMPRGAVIRRRGDGRVQDDAAGAGRRREVHRLDVLFVGADIADMRKREGDDLPGIGRIGEDFLIAGHGGIEADLADGVAGRAKTEAFEHGAVGQHQERRRRGLVPEAKCLRTLCLRLCQHGQGLTSSA